MPSMGGKQMSSTKQSILFKKIEKDGDLPRIKDDKWITVLAVVSGSVETLRYHKFYGFAALRAGVRPIPETVTAWSRLPKIKYKI